LKFIKDGLAPALPIFSASRILAVQIHAAGIRFPAVGINHRDDAERNAVKQITGTEAVSYRTVLLLLNSHLFKHFHQRSGCDPFAGMMGAIDHSDGVRWANSP